MIIKGKCDFCGREAILKRFYDLYFGTKVKKDNFLLCGNCHPKPNKKQSSANNRSPYWGSRR